MGNKIQKQNIGNAGEYYIASILSAHNFITTITLGRAEKYDILAVNLNNRTIKISVKTRYLSNGKGFPLSKKDEIGSSKDFYYSFIRLNEFKSEPDFWIIPSKRVNEVLYRSHRAWLNKAGKKGRKHKDSNLRHLPLEISRTNRKWALYPDNWEEELKRYYKNIEQIKEL